MQTPDEAVKIVRCPACGGRSIYASTNPFRPFCSERCKSMDFGAWASERFRLQGQQPDSDPDFAQD